ncbi:MAG TPA: YcxB family protein [Pyrinomonadaceae bacterium]|jgi:hypothetical protein|nr:YcxB family protein [Pyrinomonadaceae bacterium]
MEITYKLNPDDVQEMQWYNIQNSPTLQRSYHTVLYCTPLLLACVALLGLAAGVPVLYVAITLIAFTVFWLQGYPRIYRENIKQNTQKLLAEGRNASLLIEHRMTIEENALRVSSELADSRVSWEMVERVAATDTHIYIYIGSLTAYAVPKWAFDTRQQAEAFFDMAQSFHKRG